MTMSILDKIRQGAPECAKWLDKFAEEMSGVDADPAAHHLVQLGVVAPSQCDCEEVDLGEEARQWFHENHAVYNRAVWEIIRAQPGLLSGLRSVLMSDLKVSDYRGDMRYGKIVLKSYGQELLDNFLLRKPNPDWVGSNQ